MFVHNKTPHTQRGDVTAPGRLSSAVTAPGDRTRFPLINCISSDTAANNSLEIFYAEKITKSCPHVTEMYTLHIKFTLVLTLDNLKQTFKVTNAANINVYFLFFLNENW